jgi:HEAT repeat protein
LEKIKADGDVEGLVDAMFGRHENLALNAYGALHKMDPTRTVPHLLRALPRKSKTPGVHRRVIDLLAWSGDEEAIQALLAALGNRGFRNRADIALALKSVHDPRVCRALVPLLNESDEHLRYFVISTLGELRCADAASPLMEILKKGGESDRSSAAAALGKMGNPDATGPLLEALGDPRPEVRSSAVEALGRLADKRAVEPLLAMLEEESRQTGGKDPRWFLRHSLVQALGELNDPRACGPLLARLSDPHPQVRDATAEAYSRLRKTAQQQGLKVPAVEVVKCVGCGRWLRRSPLDSAEVLLKSIPDISGTQVYPCKACGAAFCIDCMAKAFVLGGSRQCPSCFKPSGW